MSDEFDDLNLDVDQPEPAPKGHRRAVPTQLYALVAVVLAGACAYLVWLYNEDRAIIKHLQSQTQRAQDQHEELSSSSKEVRKALTELANHAANEAELHHSQENRKQALADIDRAQKLLQLADGLKTCNCPSETESIQAVQNKLDKLMADIQPIQQELSQPAPAESAVAQQADATSAEAKTPQPRPEQPNKSGEQHSGEEPDA